MGIMDRKHIEPPHATDIGIFVVEYTERMKAGPTIIWLYIAYILAKSPLIDFVFIL